MELAFATVLVREQTNCDYRFRRTVYDTERAAAQMHSYGEWAEPIVRRIERGSD